MRIVRQHFGPSHWGWAFLLLLAVLTAFALRFWDLDNSPPGLYRDEAYNGLDALALLDGQFELYFSANNGREPGYIYLTALMVALFGRTVLAVRAGAALAGAVTTALVFQLGRTWFDRRTGLLAAWIWAITLWPVHLSRLGLRPILLAPFLAAALWLGTRAYRSGRRRDWLLAGLIYGLTFYTYLAARFTPLLLLAGASYLALIHDWRRVWRGVGPFLLGSLLTLAPLLLLLAADPALVLGRTGQVSILNRAVNGGDLWGTFWRQTGASLGLFLWQGDTILRHNPAGRPVFDIFMALPFLLGVAWCLRHWRRPAAAWLLLWQLVMLGPTLLAEDAPHFLRAAGLLPGVVLLPALGLSQIGSWSKLRRLQFTRDSWLTGGGQPASRSGREGTRGRQWSPVLLTALLAASLFMTIRDYDAYRRAPETAYLFEAAARDLATSINNESPATTVLVDEKFWQRWPAITYLVDSAADIQPFQPAAGLPESPRPPTALYLWPYEAFDFSATPPAAPALATLTLGSLARGDLEQFAYPLYLRLTIEAAVPITEPVVDFDNDLQLLRADVAQPEADLLLVTLYWQGRAAPRTDVKIFVHLVDADGTLLSQSDTFPGAGYWPAGWWQPGITLADTHQLVLNRPVDPDQQHIVVGLYDTATLVRLPAGDDGADAVTIWPQ